MPNARQITQQIADFVAAGGRGADGAELSTLATAYAGMTRQVYDRLGRCHDYLARGLRSEAVQEADLEPGLLGMVVALEFDAFEQWREYCRKNELAEPYPMSRQVAAELNRAYAADKLVAPLLCEYRFRCLAKTPLIERIAALRGLAGLDKNNRVWNESLVELETRRLEELRTEIGHAGADIEKLSAIQRELLDDRRRVPAPAAFVERVETALRSARVNGAQDELRALLPALHEAYSAMDQRACDRLLESWNDTLKAVGQSHLHLPDDLREPVQPIMDWLQGVTLQRQREGLFREACTRLQASIDKADGLEALTRAYEQAAAFGLPLPGTLAEDHRRARQQLELSASRKRRNRLAAAAGVVLVAGASVGWAVNQRIAEQRFAERLAQVDTDLTRMDFRAAEEKLESLTEGRPRAADRSDVQQARQRLDEAVAKEQTRRDAFVALHEQLEEAGPAELRPQDLDEIDALARSDQEKNQARALRVASDEWRRQRTAQREAEVLSRGGELQKQLAEIKAERIDDAPEAVLDELAPVRRALLDLRAMPDLSPAPLALLDAVGQREEQLRRAADFVIEQRKLAERQDASLQRVLSAAAAADRLAEALNRFAQEHPEASARGDAFRAAADDAGAWRAVEAWQKLIDAVDADTDPTELTQVAQRIRELDAYLQDHPRSPVAGEVAAYRAYWAQALIASSDTGPWLGRLPEILRAPVIRDLNVLPTSSGKRYYVVGQGKRRETSVGTAVEVVLSPDITRTQEVYIKPGRAGEIVASPQSRLAADLLGLIADYDLRGWGTFHLDVLETILSRDGVDTVLRAVLATLVIDEHEKAVGKIDPGLARLRKQLSANDENALNWLDPNDLAAATVREHLDAAIAERLPDFGALRRRAETHGRQTRAAFTRRLRARGVLLRDGLRPEVQGATAVLRDGWVACLAAENGAEPQAPYDLARIGSVRDGALRLEGTATVGVPDGSMVFFFDAEPAEAAEGGRGAEAH